MALGLGTDGKGWVRWPKPVCGALREPHPMAPSQERRTPTNGLAADLFFGDLLVNLHLHLLHKADPPRSVEIHNQGFSETWGACGFRWSLWWSLLLED
jgi:hypothetical protein